MRQKLIAGNWKMNGTLAENQTRLTQLVSGLKASSASVAVCVPAPYFTQCQSVLGGTDIQLGSQNLSEYSEGAYTGEISGSMLQDFGCQYALVGHSERRELFAESSEQVAQKFKAALNARITPVLCVGETLEQREAGITENIIADQISAVLAKVGIQGFSRAVIAYEPVWAIGTGETASAEQAQEMHAFIRSIIEKKYNKEVADEVSIL